MKTVWFYENQHSRLRRIWAAIYRADRVRRAQWTRVLETALETLAAVEPFIDDERAAAHIRNQTMEIVREVESWHKRPA